MALIETALPPETKFQTFLTHQPLHLQIRVWTKLKHTQYKPLKKKRQPIRPSDYSPFSQLKKKKNHLFLNAKNAWTIGRSPARVIIQDLQDLLVSPACSGLDERQNATSAVQVVFFLSHGERGARLHSGWGGRGRTAQWPPLRTNNLGKGKGRKRQKRKERKE